MTEARSAVITGRGVISALGPDMASFAAAVRGRRGAPLSPAPGSAGPDIPLCYALPEGLLPDGKRDEPQSTLATMAVAQALAEAGIEAGHEPLDDVGLIMNNVLGPSGAIESYIEALAAKGPRPMKPSHFVDTLLSMPGSRVGIALKLRGSTAVLGGSSPFELALSWLRRGREHTVVAGAAECLSPKCIRFHRELARRSGSERLPLGQGAAFLVLETPAEARRRAATSYGEILGAGAASEPQEVSVPWSVDLSGRAFELSMRAAIADAGVSLDDITVIGLAAGELESQAGEVAGVERVFRARMPSLEFGRLKPLFGEALAASAGLGLLATLVELEGRASTAIVNSFEQGGAITSLVVRAPQ
jgi:3-oxoacyl-[acyl-carrier-protein] synthase II